MKINEKDEMVPSVGLSIRYSNQEIIQKIYKPEVEG